MWLYNTYTMRSTYNIVVKRNCVHLLLHTVQFLLELGFHFHSSSVCVCVCVGNSCLYYVLPY